MTTGPPVASWLWDFGDGTTSSDENPTHTFASAGAYNVTLTAFGNAGEVVSNTIDSVAIVYDLLPTGSYQIGGPGADFVDIEAFNNAVRCGITGDVLVTFANGVYDQALILDNVATNGSLLSFTSESATKDSVLINRGIYIKQVNGLSFQQLAFNFASNPADATIQLENCNNINFEDCLVYGPAVNNVNFDKSHFKLDNANNVSINSCIFENSPVPNQFDANIKLVDMINSKIVEWVGNTITGTFTSSGPPFCFSTIRDCEHLLFQDMELHNFFALITSVDTISFINNIFYSPNINLDSASYVRIHSNYADESIHPFELKNSYGYSILDNRLKSGGIILINSIGDPNNDFDLIGNNAIGGDLGNSIYDYSAGIGLFNCQNTRVYHNSVLFDKTAAVGSNDWGAALKVVNSQNTDIKNNLFRTDNVPYPGRNGVVYLYGNTDHVSDYNVFQGNEYMWNLTQPGNPNGFETFEEYRSASGYEEHSTQVDINYLGQFDLHLDPISAGVLNDAVPALASLPFDLDGNPRGSSFVDPGAYESNAPSNISDINLDALLNPNLSLGENYFSVKILNQRPKTQDSIYITFKINNKATVTELWTGTLAPFETLEYTFTTPLQIDKGMLFKTTIWVELPPSQHDLYHANDTLYTEFSIPMEGIYSLGGNNADFDDGLTANESTMVAGLSGDVTFQMANGTYAINQNLENQSDWVVTYQSLSGNPEDVQFSPRYMYESNNFTFQNLTLVIYSNNLYQQQGFDLAKAKNITFKNCIIDGNDITSTIKNGVSVRPACRDIVWENCVFRNLDFAISFVNYPIVGYSHHEGSFIISDCTFEDIGEYAIFFNSTTTPSETFYLSIHKCQFTGSDYPILIKPGAFKNNFDLEVTSCFFKDTNVPVDLDKIGSGSHNMLIANNFFSKTGNIQIRDFYPGNYSLLYNSFNEGGGVSVYDSASVKVYNNSFFGSSTSTNTVLFWMDGISYEGDYNNYFNPGTGGKLMNYKGTNIFSIDEMPNITSGQDSHSISVIPSYTTNSDLHLSYYSKLRGAGTPLADIKVDYDGEPRDTIAPNIGADEYNSCTFCDTLPTTISGIVFHSNSSFLVDTKVLLVKVENDYVSIVDSTYTGAFGNYSFTTTEPLVYLKVIPEVMAYPDQLPTYHSSFLVIQDAQPIVLNQPTQNATIFSKKGVNPGGPGFISGYITQGAGFVSGPPINGLSIFLMNADNVPLNYTYTDDDGFFYFDNIPIGTYYFWVDQLNIENTVAPKLVITDLTPEIGNLNFELNSTYLDLIEPSLPQPISSVTLIEPLLCADDTIGIATVVGAGGTAPYLFIWDNGETTDTAFMLSSGLHTVTLIDSNAQVSEATIELIPPPPFSTIFQTLDASCFGDTTGSVTVEIDGGTPPYFLDWGGVDTSALMAGDYSLIITDNYGCSNASNFTINEPTELVVSETIISASCMTCHDGKIELEISGGTLPYEVEWSNGQLGAFLDSLVTGIYEYTLVDSNGCILTGIINVDFYVVAFEENRNLAKVYPNPTTSAVYIELPAYEHLEKWNLHDRLGKKIQHGTKLTVEMESLPEGIYFLEIIMNNKSFWWKIMKKK